MNVLHIANVRTHREPKSKKRDKSQKKKSGISRRERRLIKQQSALLNKGKEQKVVAAESIPQEPILQIPNEVMQKVYRILKEFRYKEERFVPVSAFSCRNAEFAYGLTTHHGRPAPQVTEITYYELAE